MGNAFQFKTKILTLSCSILLSVPSFAQDTLKILSWNIQMLPNVTEGNSRAKRAKAIVGQLNARDYDVLIFQELFHRRARKIVSKGLTQRYPYHTPVLNKKAIAFKTNGGVMIFSRHKILGYQQIRFKSRTGFDRMSRKGALLADISFNGKEIQVAGTHLQAFGAQEIMYSQYDQISSELLFPNHKSGVPQFIGGDFNTLKSLPPKLPDNVSQTFVDRLARYHVMLQTLQATDGDLAGEQQFTMDRPYNDLCVTRKEYRLLLDYILLRSDRPQPYLIERKVRIIRQRWSPQHQDLSDHFAVEALVTGF
ncbi:MAG TPA: endonuclease/exonuclease/phosphatase family protein [Cyclobacteriaceae bacterium]|nr:endonuclease/exonuclease/phosphatase family protein [Cyclobacteriaceae bacterium]